MLPNNFAERAPTPLPPIEYEVHSSGSKYAACVKCTFNDDTLTYCVAVVHQQTSQLSRSGLMKIESSHKFNRSDDTAYGCIEGVNLEKYQVGVIGGNETQLTKQNESDDDTLLNLFMTKTIEWYAISVAESRISDVTYIKWE